MGALKEENVPCSKDIPPDRFALAELQELIGLDSLKREVSKHINLYKINERRKARGMQVPSISMHMVFTGNPGSWLRYSLTAPGETSSPLHRERRMNSLECARRYSKSGARISEMLGISAPCLTTPATV